MKINVFLMSIVGMFLLSSCGSSSGQRRVKRKKKAAPAPVVAQEPVEKEAKPQGFAAKMGATPPESTKKSPTAPVKEAVKSAAPKATGSNTSFPDDYVSGKNLSEWLRDLDSKDAEKVIEACGVLELVGKKASSASGKLEALTKNANKEIAEAAKAALQKVK